MVHCSRFVVLFQKLKEIHFFVFCGVKRWESNAFNGY